MVQAGIEGPDGNCATKIDNAKQMTLHSLSQLQMFEDALPLGSNAQRPPGQDHCGNYLETVLLRSSSRLKFVYKSRIAVWLLDSRPEDFRLPGSNSTVGLRTFVSTREMPFGINNPLPSSMRSRLYSSS